MVNYQSYMIVSIDSRHSFPSTALESMKLVIEMYDINISTVIIAIVRVAYRFFAGEEKLM